VNEARLLLGRGRMAFSVGDVDSGVPSEGGSSLFKVSAGLTLVRWVLKRHVWISFMMTVSSYSGQTV